MNALQISQFVIRYVDTQRKKQSSIPPVYHLVCPKLQPKHSLAKTTLPLLLNVQIPIVFINKKNSTQLIKLIRLGFV